MAGVSLVRPLPVAPKSITLNFASLNFGNGKFGGVNGFAVSAACAGDSARPQINTMESMIRFMGWFSVLFRRACAAFDFAQGIGGFKTFRRRNGVEMNAKRFNRRAGA